MYPGWWVEEEEWSSFVAILRLSSHQLNETAGSKEGSTHDDDVDDNIIVEEQWQENKSPGVDVSFECGWYLIISVQEGG